MQFTREQVEHAIRTAPRIKGVFEKYYELPLELEAYKGIAYAEIRNSEFATNDQTKLKRLQIAEAALDIYDYLKGSQDE